MPRNGSNVYSLPTGSIVTDGVDDILASQHNTPLQDLESDMNTARPVVAGGTGQTTIPAARSAFGLVGANIHATYGGTANAITITTGIGLSALVTGMRITFLATSANTGATTINVDGTGALDAVNVIGTALASGYIRTDAFTEAVYDGTDWVVNRAVEYGAPTAGVNGRFWKYADGTMLCIHTQSATNNITDAAGNIFRGTTERTWTYPATFTEQPTISASFDRENGWILSSGYSFTEFRYRPALPVSTASVTNDVNLAAHGRWY